MLRLLTGAGAVSHWSGPCLGGCTATLLHRNFSPLRLHALRPTLANVGVQGFRMVFRSQRYAGEE